MSYAITVFDVETGSADRLYDHSGPFVRLSGWSSDGGQPQISTDSEQLADALRSSEIVTGHNIISYDLPAMSSDGHGGLDLLTLADENRIVDTYLLASLRWPPGFWETVSQAQRRYSLNAVSEKLGLPGKTDDVKALAKRFGGFDQIPVDDPQFQDYLRGDVAASSGVSTDFLSWMGSQSSSQRAYLQREHRVHALISTVTGNGVRVDIDEAVNRYSAGEERRAEMKDRLSAQYDIPITKTITYKTKPDKIVDITSPTSTTEGHAALIKAFESLGIPQDVMPRTPKNKVSFSGKTIRQVLDFRSSPELEELVELVETLTGIRTVYGTAIASLKYDGKVHPSNLTLQASGRLSTSKPCMTTFGKRSGRVFERGIFIADSPDEVLIPIDLSQVDARSVAVHSQDPAYMALFEPGRDSHVEVAKMVWGDPSRRSDAKAIAHGWNYGMGLTKLSESAGVSVEEASRFDRAMKDNFPRLVQWKDEVREFAAATGYVENGFGRRLQVNKDRVYTQAPALVGQGTARDVLFEGLLGLPHEIKHKIRMFVHDEVVLSVARKDAKEVTEQVVDSMSFEWAPPGFSRPITFDADASTPSLDWANCYA